VHAADTVLRRIAGQEPAPATIGFFGQCISLGRGGGIFQFAHRNDHATKYHLAGRPGAALKEFVCWGTVQQLVMEARRPGLFNFEFAQDKSRAARLTVTKG
jgi:hypothetical protein